MLRTEAEIMCDIVDTWGALQPEELGCDGERSPRRVEAERKRLTKRMAALQKELGRDVEEDEIVEWFEKHEERL